MMAQTTSWPIKGFDVRVTYDTLPHGTPGRFGGGFFATYDEAAKAIAEASGDYPGMTCAAISPVYEGVQS